MNNNEQVFIRLISRYKTLMVKSRDAVGLIAVELFNESFERQGQIMGNGSVKNWKHRGFSPPSRANARLLKKRGRLQRSINYKKGGVSKVFIQSDTPYSQIQNEGGTIKVTAKMRRFFWAMVYQNWQRGVSYDIKTRDLHGSKRNMKLGQEAEFWLKLAMAKEIKIAARPFIYDTPELPRRIDNYFIIEIERITQ